MIRRRDDGRMDPKYVREQQRYSRSQLQSKFSFDDMEVERN